MEKEQVPNVRGESESLSMCLHYICSCTKLRKRRHRSQDRPGKKNAVIQDSLHIYMREPRYFLWCQVNYEDTFVVMMEASLAPGSAQEGGRWLVGHSAA